MLAAIVVIPAAQGIAQAALGVVPGALGSSSRTSTCTHLGTWEDICSHYGRGISRHGGGSMYTSHWFSNAIVLFDSGCTHSFVSHTHVSRMGVEVEHLGSSLVVTTRPGAVTATGKPVYSFTVVIL